MRLRTWYPVPGSRAPGLLIGNRVDSSVHLPANGMETTMRDANERDRLLVERSPDGIAISQDSRIVFVNPAATRLFAASGTEQLHGESLFDLFDADSHATIRERLDQLQDDCEPVPPMEANIVRLDGAATTVEITVTVLEGPRSGEPTIVWVIRDITARKQIEI